MTGVTQIPGRCYTDWMAKSDSIGTGRNSFFEAKGVKASQLRRRRHELSRKYELPDDLLGGSLVLSHRRCGRQSCWCAADAGHPQWTLTYSVHGNKQVENIPANLVEQLMPLINGGLAYRDAVTEIRSINAQLLKLWRLQEREKKSKTTGKVKRRRR